MRKLLAFALLFPGMTASMSGQILPKGNVFAGYSYERFYQPGGDANLNGWAASAEGKFFFRWFGVVADVSGEYGTPHGISVKQYNFLAGPRISLSVGKTRFFAHVLGGYARMNNSIIGFSDTDHSFAYALGGGLDHKVFHLVTWRLQGDFLRTQLFGNTQKNVRVATGPVLNF